MLMQATGNALHGGLVELVGRQREHPQPRRAQQCGDRLGTREVQLEGVEVDLGVRVRVGVRVGGRDEGEG